MGLRRPGSLWDGRIEEGFLKLMFDGSIRRYRIFVWALVLLAGSGCASCPVHEGATASPAKPLVTLDLGSPATGNALSGRQTGRNA